MRWSYEGPIANMTCTLTAEAHTDNGSDNNHLCLPTHSTYQLTWTSTNATENYWKCVNWFEAANHEWGDANFMCIDGKEEVSDQKYGQNPYFY
jgi:hypothetical protein